MNRKYYSSRNNLRKVTLKELYQKLISLYLMFRNKDYFKGEADIRDSDIPEEIKHKAMLVLNFQPFPIEEWSEMKITENNIFDIIEYLYDHVSKPGELIDMTTDTGWNYSDYESYNKEAGRTEYKSYVNDFLCLYRSGYELTKDGIILSLGSDGIQNLIQAKLPVLGEKNIDHKVQNAIIKWRNRDLSIHERREAIRELADVFEWLKKSNLLKSILCRKDESMLFEIANKFSIRHHNPKQHQNYDENVWYSWMFHFYLATYHAIARMIAKKNNEC